MKASKCHVPGCKTMTPRKDMRTLLYDAAKSHYDLQHGERQRLLATMKAKVRSQIGINRLDPLTTRQLRQNGYTWRAILTKDLNLFLQLASATFPVTVELW
ncbi:uncharacterized protein LOC110059598 [Orbicella faveolata]|uniref:uncharacterized protein LOC110059598 n=1 Tax=Orbicella faveolata TaxID=48498 RepID=UPI0009E44591|nr:uncharacterized protein LOC110059598 [Orbicella faveolata]